MQRKQMQKARLERVVNSRGRGNARIGTSHGIGVERPSSKSQHRAVYPSTQPARPISSHQIRVHLFCLRIKLTRKVGQRYVEIREHCVRELLHGRHCDRPGHRSRDLGRTDKGHTQATACAERIDRCGCTRMVVVSCDRLKPGDVEPIQWNTVVPGYCRANR